VAASTRIPAIPARRVVIDTLGKPGRKPGLDLGPARVVTDITGPSDALTGDPIRYVLESDGGTTGIYDSANVRSSDIAVADEPSNTVHQARMELIFWGPAWQDQADEKEQMEQLIGAVGRFVTGNPYLEQLDQYGLERRRIQFTSVYVNRASTPPAHDDWQDTHKDVANMVRRLLVGGHFGPALPLSRRLIAFVFLPEGATVGNAGGAHQYVVNGPQWGFDIVWFGWVAYRALDFMTAVFSHELTEIITDPDARSGYHLARKFGGYKLELSDVCQDVVDYADGTLVQGYWSNRHRACIIPRGTAPPPAAPAGAVTSLALSPSAVDLFWTAPGNQLWFAEWRAGGQWVPTWEVAAKAVGRCAAVSQRSDMLDVFWLDDQGGIWWTAWSANSGAWTYPRRLWASQAAYQAMASSLSACSIGYGLIALFWTTNDGAVWHLEWDLGNDSWSAAEQWRPSGTASPFRGGTACVAHRDGVSLCYVDALDGLQIYRRAGRGQELVGLGDAVVGSAVCVARNAGIVEAFWVAGDGSVRNSTCRPHQRFNAWSGERQLFGAGTALNAIPRMPAIASCARTPNHLDLFWIAPDGSIWCSSSNLQRIGVDKDGQPTLGGWAEPAQVPNCGPGTARSDLTACSRTPTHVDLFFAAPDGSLTSAYSDLVVFNVALWRGPFEVTAASLVAAP
jgi:hypothetical protein